MTSKLIFFTLFLFLFGTLLIAQPVKEHGHLKVDGIQLKDENGNALVLRGMSYGWHNMWPRFYNASSVNWLIKDWGCTVLRASMGINLDRKCYLKKPEWSKGLICTVVDAAIKEGIYVIIDWHNHHINLKEAKDFFNEMSQKYGKYPNVIYEIFNEPDYESWDEVKKYSIEVMNAIRSNDPDNIILVGSPHWDQDLHLVADDPIKGFTNIMYSLHFYAATHKQWYRDRADNAMKKGIPLFISEYGGMEANGDGFVDYKEWDTWIEWAEKNKLSWIAWSVSDKKEKCSVLLKSAKSEGYWEEKDLNETGRYARKLLRKYNLGEK